MFGPHIPSPNTLTESPSFAIPLTNVKLMSVKAIGRMISVVPIDRKLMGVNCINKKKIVDLIDSLTPHGSTDPIMMTTALASCKTKRRMGRGTTCMSTSSTVIIESLEFLHILCALVMSPLNIFIELLYTKTMYQVDQEDTESRGRSQAVGRTGSR